MKKIVFTFGLIFIGFNSYANKDLCNEFSKLTDKALVNVSAHECIALLDRKDYCQGNPDSEMCKITKNYFRFCRAHEENGVSYSGMASLCRKENGEYVAERRRKELCKNPDSILRLGTVDQFARVPSRFEPCSSMMTYSKIFPYSVSGIDSNDGPKEEEPAVFNCSTDLKNNGFPGLSSSIKVDTGQESLETLAFDSSSIRTQKEVCIGKSVTKEGYPVFSFSEFDMAGRTANHGHTEARTGVCIGRDKDANDPGEVYCTDIDFLRCRTASGLYKNAKTLYGENFDKTASPPIRLLGWSPVGFMFKDEAHRVLAANLKHSGRINSSYASFLGQHALEIVERRKKAKNTEAGYAVSGETNGPGILDDTTPEKEQKRNPDSSIYEAKTSRNHASTLNYLDRLIGKDNYDIPSPEEWTELLATKPRRLKVYLELVKARCEQAGHPFRPIRTGGEPAQKSAPAAN